MHQSHPPYNIRVSSNRALYLEFLSTYTICIIYLHVTCNRSYYCYVLFLPFKYPFRCYEKYFYFHLSIYLGKILLVNKYKKQTWLFVCLFFDVVKKCHIFPSKVCHFQYGHRFPFSKETRNIRAYKDVPFKMRNHLGRVFPCYFLQNVSIETSYVSYLVLLPFLNVIKFEDSKHIKRYIFHYFL